MGWICTRGAGQQESRVGRESVVTEQGQGPGSLKGRLVRQGGSCKGCCEARFVILAREPGWALGSVIQLGFDAYFLCCPP